MCTQDWSPARAKKAKVYFFPFLKVVTLKKMGRKKSQMIKNFVEILFLCINSKAVLIYDFILEVIFGFSLVSVLRQTKAKESPGE